MSILVIKAFKRYEIKYLINTEQFKVIEEELKKRMVLDKNCKDTGSYLIYNLYLDTEGNEIIRQSTNKPYYKEKLRLRSYRILTSGKDTVYLELKKKIGGVVAKRRAAMSYDEALQFVFKGTLPPADNYMDKQVVDEISDFLQRYPSKPKVFISYERVAYFDRDNKDFRISFDRNVITRRNQVNLMDGDFGSELLDNDIYLMEIKLSTNIPLWLCRLLSSMKIYKTSFSKYGTEYMQFVKQTAAAKVPDTVRIYKNVPVYDISEHIITA